METLTIKELAPYLPYGLKSYHLFQGHHLIKEIDCCNVMGFINGDTKHKPLLRPLSDLTKLINDDKKNIKYYRLLSTCYSESDLRNFIQSPTAQRYEDVQILFENHFDVFGLIEKGLAIDLNTIKETVK